jgi:hypothetical protein
MEVAGDPVISMRPQRPPPHSTIARLKGCGEAWQVGHIPPLKTKWRRRFCASRGADSAGAAAAWSVCKCKGLEGRITARKRPLHIKLYISEFSKAEKKLSDQASKKCGR